MYLEDTEPSRESREIIEKRAAQIVCARQPNQPEKSQALRFLTKT